MGQVKRLWQDKIEEINSDFMDSKISFNDAYRALCNLGYDPDYAADSLESGQQERNLRTVLLVEPDQSELFPEAEQVTFTGMKYGEAKYDKETKG